MAYNNSIYEVNLVCTKLLIEGSKEWEGVFKVKDKYTIADFRKKYQISDELAEKLK